MERMRNAPTIILQVRKKAKKTGREGLELRGSTSGGPNGFTDGPIKPALITVMERRHHCRRSCVAGQDSGLRRPRRNSG